LQRCKAVRGSLGLHGGGGQSKLRAAATFLAQTPRVCLLWSTKKEGQGAFEKKFLINAFPGEPGNMVSLAQNILETYRKSFHDAATTQTIWNKNEIGTVRNEAPCFWYREKD
jgi:hypothetical protein